MSRKNKFFAILALVLMLVGISGCNNTKEVKYPFVSSSDLENKGFLNPDQIKSYNSDLVKYFIENNPLNIDGDVMVLVNVIVYINNNHITNAISLQGTGTIEEGKVANGFVGWFFVNYSPEETTYGTSYLKEGVKFNNSKKFEFTMTPETLTKPNNYDDNYFNVSNLDLEKFLRIYFDPISVNGGEY